MDKIWLASYPPGVPAEANVLDQGSHLSLDELMLDSGDAFVQYTGGTTSRPKVGLPDERAGEAVVLFVVPADPSLTVEAVRTHC